MRRKFPKTKRHADRQGETQCIPSAGVGVKRIIFTIHRNRNNMPAGHLRYLNFINFMALYEV